MVFVGECGALVVPCSEENRSRFDTWNLHIDRNIARHFESKSKERWVRKKREKKMQHNEDNVQSAKVYDR